MDMDNAAAFLGGSILFGLGVIAIGIAILVINNLFSKYWKPVQWTMLPDALAHSFQNFSLSDHPAEPVKEEPKGKTK